MGYTIRFTLPAVFKLSRILKKTGLARQALALFKPDKKAEKGLSPEENADKDLSSEAVKAKREEMGMDIIASIIENAGEAENEVYDLMAIMSGVPVADIKKMELKDVQAFIRAVGETEDLKDFFTQALRSAK